MLALTHHIIVQAAARKHSTAHYTDYAIVGDDITLTGSAIASFYTSIISTLGVSINMAKSITYTEGATPAAEFCKRLYIAGVEYTTFPIKLMAKTIMNGRLAPQLQNELLRRGMSSTDPHLMAWLAGLIDKDSGRFLLVLNMLPTSVTSLLGKLVLPSSVKDLTTWYGDKYALTSNDVVQAHLYVAITEQLKRLDNLLRQSQIIASAIETNAFGYSKMDPKVLGWSYSSPEIELAKLAASMPKLTATHPIVKASQIEMDRLSELLADLRTGDSGVTQRAQRRVLDMFRNSLIDAWADGDAARAQADRSLLQRALTLLSDIVVNRATESGGLQPHTVEYTVNLAFLNRLWVVSWTLGHNVTINAVKSRVLGTSDLAQNRLTSIVENVDIVTMFAPPIKASKGGKSVTATTTPGAKAVNAEVQASTGLQEPDKSS
jgi:hypothetical protein